ncbi:MAG: 3-hydroxyacyl-CoA dehydrogenase NAD-binding domain-containing protein [Neomegalonema sp.]|nr:3-hydroxyacyl-CoA dehydrogenase NAD-binding domain-containing protein [Neomegalonema sp.]
MSENFHYRLEDDGVAVITWDIGPERSMNVLTEAGIRELDAHIDNAIADDAVKGVVITSAKPDLAGGMDLNVIAALRARAEELGNTAETLFGFIMELHKVLRKIERMGADPKTGKGGKPVAVATPGTALGIGFELMLAAHHRVAADNPAAKIGLPEVLIGIFPGAGGTTRLYRMLGLMAAAPYLMEGKLLAPAKAKGAGLIDAVVPPEELLAAAKQWVLSAKPADIVKPWDQKGFKLPGGHAYHPAGFQLALGGVAMTHAKSQGNYPGINGLLSALYEGGLVDFDTAIRIEARWFTHVLMDPRSEAMIRSLFVNKQAIEKGARRPKDQPDLSVQKLGVIGAGMMGAGIAYVAATAGIEVVLLDRDLAGAERGKAGIADLVADSVKKKRVTAEAGEAVLSRVTPSADYAALSGADLVVEAVFEEPGLKARVTAAAEAEIAPEAIFASNTSTIPITDLSRASARPENFIGIHFFSPVHKMMLVEIIKTATTSDAAVAKALDFVRQLKKTPIVVNDARFFYANRCIIPYINEGIRMVAEGIAPALVENAAKGAGMPLGPLQLCDETSLELGWKIAQATRAAMGDAYEASPADDLLQWMVEYQARLGRKAQAGFYAYDERGKRAGLWSGLTERYPLSDRQPDVEEVKNRLLAIQALEAVRALEEGVLVDIREGDVAAILGWGFAPWSGGPFSWIDLQGSAEFARLCDDLAMRHGPRFAVPPQLRAMATHGARFYPAPKHNSSEAA